MLLQGNIVCFDRAGYGTLEIVNNVIGKIELCGPCRNDADWIVPGFIDVHLHGASGYDVCDATPEAIAAIAEAKLAEGCTTFLPSTRITSWWTSCPC